MNFELIKSSAISFLESTKKEFDLTITSPPYNKLGAKNSGALVKKVEYESFSDSIPEEEYQQQQIEVLNKLFNRTKIGGSCFYNHKIRWHKGVMIHPMEWLLQTDWTIKQQIIWDRTISANLRGWRFWQKEELIFWLYKPRKKGDVGIELASKFAKLGFIWKIGVERKNNHPAAFPVELPFRIISAISNGEKLEVLDPYSGSGTTGIAAVLCGCKYTGVDISDKYIEDSKERIQNAKGYEKVVEKERSQYFVKKSYSERKKVK